MINVGAAEKNTSERAVEDGGRIQRRSLCGGWTASQPFD